MATSVTPTKTPRLLPFVKPPASEAEQWDGWVVTSSGDDAADYLKGREYAREAVEAAKEYGDVAPVAYSLACLYAKAHLVGKSSHVLKSQGQRGNYRMLDAGVPDAAFKAGPKGAFTG